MKATGRSLLFVNKKKQKNFINYPWQSRRARNLNVRSFFASFCSQKEDFFLRLSF